MNNKEAFDSEKENGNLASVGNGPKTKFQKLIGFGYPITLFILSIVTFLLVDPKTYIKDRVFWIYMVIVSVCGCGWGIYIGHVDPNHPAWLFYPWSITNWVDTGLVLEDWLFYPLCAWFFYVIMKKFKKEEKQSSDFSLSMVLIVSTLLFLIVPQWFSTCGKSLSVFGMLGLCFYVSMIRFRIFKVKHFLKVIGFLSIFAMVWDYLAVSWLRMWTHWSWLSHWSYVTFDRLGQAHHSNVFLSYEKYPWAWIWNNPIEVTPWMALTVVFFTYNLLEFLEMKLNKKSS